MKNSTSYKIDSVRVALLYGDPHNFATITEAVSYINEQPDRAISSTKPLFRVEATVRYKDGMRLWGEFPQRRSAKEWLLNREKGII